MTRTAGLSCTDLGCVRAALCTLTSGCLSDCSLTMGILGAGEAARYRGRSGRSGMIGQGRRGCMRPARPLYLPARISHSLPRCPYMHRQWMFCTHPASASRVDMTCKFTSSASCLSKQSLTYNDLRSECTAHLSYPKLRRSRPKSQGLSPTYTISLYTLPPIRILLRYLWYFWYLWLPIRRIGRVGRILAHQLAHPPASFRRLRAA
jgi:hypothetical protein